MLVGVSFILPNQWGKPLTAIFHDVNIQEMQWRIEENDVLEDSKQQNFKFEEWVTGRVLSKAANGDDYCILLAKYLAFANQNEYAHINDLSGFLNSSCQIALLVYDGVYVDFYAKDKKIIDTVCRNAEAFKCKNIDVLTAANDTRTSFNLY